MVMSTGFDPTETGYSGTQIVSFYTTFRMEIKKMKSVRFRKKLAMELIGSYCSRKRAGRGSHVVKPLPLLHLPIRLPADSGHHL